MYQHEKCFIYCITDPITNEPRYIGKTVCGEIRFKNHLSKSKLIKKTKKNNWIKSLLKKDKTPIFQILEFGKPEELGDLEVFYISYFKYLGFKLLNMTLS